MGSTKKIKDNGNKCAAAGCYRTARKHKKKKGGVWYGKYCTTCDKKIWREANPMKYAYQNFLSNAKRRKIFCDVTWEEFQEFCFEEDYMQGKGKTSTSFSIDRRIEGKLPGYTKSNLQKLPLGVNTQKEMFRRKGKQLTYHWESGTFTVIANTEQPDSEDNPF